jgi:hypothetical protein
MKTDVFSGCVTRRFRPGNFVTLDAVERRKHAMTLFGEPGRRGELNRKSRSDANFALHIDAS